MPSFTRESGGTLHVAVMGVNRIGKDHSSKQGIDMYPIPSNALKLTLDSKNPDVNILHFVFVELSNRYLS